LDKERLSLIYPIVELELDGAQVSYLRLGETERETITTEGGSIKISLNDQLIPKGGWLL
jgi:hypothetical protein